MFYTLNYLGHYINSQSLLKPSRLAHEGEQIFLRAVLGDQIVFHMSFVYVEALDDIRMVEGPQYFYFILQHLHTRRAIVLEVYHFDCALTTGSTVNSSIHDAAETLTYFFTDVVYISSDAFLLREELRTIRDPHSRDTAPQMSLF